MDDPPILWNYGNSTQNMIHVSLSICNVKTKYLVYIINI